MNPGREGDGRPGGWTVLTVAVAVIVGLAPFAHAASFVPLAQFDCGAAGTFFSEVMPIPASVSSPLAPALESKVRLLTLEGGETNSVIVLLHFTSLSTGQIIFTNPGFSRTKRAPTSSRAR
jgi:hypothetical protein